MNKRQQELQKQVGAVWESLNFKSSRVTFVFVVFLVIVTDVAGHLHVICCHFVCPLLQLQGHTCRLSALYPNRATII